VTSLTNFKPPSKKRGGAPGIWRTFSVSVKNSVLCFLPNPRFCDSNGHHKTLYTVHDFGGSLQCDWGGSWSMGGVELTLKHDGWKVRLELR
jgi:hypothetical protein